MRNWPVPGTSLTRATDVLRRPVAEGSRTASGKGQDLRLLRGVRMLRAAVDLELREHLPAEVVLRQHAAHRGLEHALGMRAVEHLGGGRRLEPARPARVALVDLVLALVAGELHVRRVHHDDEVAGVEDRKSTRLNSSHSQISYAVF